MLGNYGPQPGFINKVLWVHSHPICLNIVCGFFGLWPLKLKILSGSQQKRFADSCSVLMWILAKASSVWVCGAEAVRCW